MIIEGSGDFNSIFPVASSYVEMLQHLSDNLRSGNYILSKKKEIIRYRFSHAVILIWGRYPTVKNVSVATTRGVKITCCPLFVPERSAPNSPNPSYFFAYRIIMEMSPLHPASDSCVLRTRKWIIQDGRGKIEHVNGPGVIGITTKHWFCLICP